MNQEQYREAVEALQSYIAPDVAAGFRSRDEIVESVVEMLSEEYEADEQDESMLQAEAQRIADEEFARHFAAQRLWPSTTDCDRLDAAFEELERHGIVAWQNAPCCQTCAAGEIGREMSKRLEAGEAIRGYAFYHEQDTLAAVDGHGVYLAYGSVAEEEAAGIAIGREIVGVLQRFHFQPSWDGTLGQRIFVPLKWQRRRQLE